MTPSPITVYIPTDDISATHRIYPIDPLSPLITDPKFAFESIGFFFTPAEFEAFKNQIRREVIEKEGPGIFEAGEKRAYDEDFGLIPNRYPDRDTYVKQVKEKYQL